jgi:hypothetical protein
MSTQDALKASAPAKVVINQSAEMNGSGQFVKNPKSNAVIVKTGILYRYRTISSETT